MLTFNEINMAHPLPGISLWKKDKHHLLVDVNDKFANLFGVSDRHDLIGKSDFDLPLRDERTAHNFQQADKKVLSHQKTFKFLEIYKIKNNMVRTLLTVKSPWINHSNIMGTYGYCVELPSSIFRIMKPLLDNENNSAYIVSNFNIKLTPRENECLFFIIRGNTAKEIANNLCLSRRTVEEYIASIKAKLNCHSKNELIAYCHENNLVNIFPESLFNNPLCLTIE